MSVVEDGWTWGSGNGGGALAVVLDTNGRAFGWLCDEGTGSDRGPRIECFKWFLDGGASGEDSDYARARAALANAATERVRMRAVNANPLSDSGFQDCESCGDHTALRCRNGRVLCYDCMCKDPEAHPNPQEEP